MPRAAGDSSHYEVAIIDGAGNPKGVSQYLPSVTSILDALPKYLQWWGYKLGVEATLSKIAELPPGTLPEPNVMYDTLKAEKKHTPSSVLTAAGSRGSSVHDWIEARVLEHTGGPPAPSLDPAQAGYAKGVETWLPNSGISTVLYTELPVFSMKHGFAGTLDALTYNEVEDCYYVNDWKTNEKGAVYESHQLQVVAYKAAVEEMHLPIEPKPIRARVVGFSAKGKPNEVTVDEDRCNFDTFLKVKGVWEWLQAMKT